MKKYIGANVLFKKPSVVVPSAPQKVSIARLTELASFNFLSTKNKQSD